MPCAAFSRNEVESNGIVARDDSRQAILHREEGPGGRDSRRRHRGFGDEALMDEALGGQRLLRPSRSRAMKLGLARGVHSDEDEAPMAQLEVFTGLIIGALVGAAIAFVVVQFRTTRIQALLAAKEQESKQSSDRIEQMNTRIDELNKTVSSEGARAAALEERAKRVDQLEKEKKEASDALALSNAENATIRETIKKERESWDEKSKLIEEAKTDLANAFKALSSEALKSNNASFLQLAKETLETFHAKAQGDLTEKEKAVQSLVQPLKESLERYEKQMKELETVRQGAYSGLEQQVKSLMETEKSLQKETGKLVSALSAPQVRGYWARSR